MKEVYYGKVMNNGKVNIAYVLIYFCPSLQYEFLYS